MYLMIDNYDSYVYNLVSYMEELNMQTQVVRNDKIDWEKIVSRIDKKRLKGIVISPGPKHPRDFSYLKEMIEKTAGEIPILGVCLGHQMIADVFGAKVDRGKRPMHGKISKIEHCGEHIFKNLPETFGVTRYHSLVVSEQDFPKDLMIDARSEDGAIMGISHKKYPIYGIQFHPEAVLTEYGHELLENFKGICEERSRCQHM